MIDKPLPQRFRFEYRDYTEEQRRELKAHRIKDAQEWEPPTQYSVEILVNPGEKGYEDAPFIAEWVWWNIPNKITPVPAYQDKSSTVWRRSLSRIPCIHREPRTLEPCP